MHDQAEANARLTAGTAAVLLVLLAAEGVTILQIRGLISEHVFLGMVLVPPVLVKTGSTVYRFARYYRGAPEFRRKGPPPILPCSRRPCRDSGLLVNPACGITLKGGCRWLLFGAELNVGRTQQELGAKRSARI